MLITRGEDMVRDECVSTCLWWRNFEGLNVGDYCQLRKPHKNQAERTLSWFDPSLLGRTAFQLVLKSYHKLNKFCEIF